MTEREVVAAASAMAAAAVVAVAVSPWLVATGLLVGVVVRRPLAVGAAAVLLTSFLAHRSEAGLTDVGTGSIEGRATLVSDPTSSSWGHSAEVSLDGRRYLASFGSEGAIVSDALAGESLRVRGVVSELSGSFGFRASRHLVGRLSVIEASDLESATPPLRVANGLRHLIESSLESFSPDDAALFTGIVYGDDRFQSDVVIYRYRRSGLAHLMAVSGQNVAFLLVVASPLLMVVEFRWRFWLTAAVIAMFVAVTRADPSVLRAATMALVVAHVAWRGRYATAVRVLAVSVSVLLVIDPLMVWSAGFQLSVGASAALIAMASRLAAQAARRRWWHLPLAASVAAQAGTAPVLAGLSGAVPLMGPLTNLVAVPVAGALMVWGLSVAPLAGWVGDPLATWVGWPSRALIAVLDHAAGVGSWPWWPVVGVLGAAGWSVATVSMVLSATKLRRVGIVIGVLMICADLVVGAPRGRIDAPGSARLWVDGGSAVVVIDASTSSAERPRLVEQGSGPSRVTGGRDRRWFEVLRRRSCATRRRAGRSGAGPGPLGRSRCDGDPAGSAPGGRRVPRDRRGCRWCGGRR